MANFGVMFSQQLTLLCLLAAGYLAGRLKMMDAHTRASISSVMINILVPCSIFSILAESELEAALFRNFLLMVALGFVLSAALFFVSKYLFPRIMGPRLATLRYAVVSPNSSFIGLPVIAAYYGEIGVFYLAALLIPMNFFLWGFGKRLFVKEPFWRSLRDIFISPVIIATALGFVVFVTGLPLPVFFTKATGILGDATTVLSMLFSGSVLADTDIRSMFSKQSFYYCFLRLAAIPLLTLGVVCAAHVPTMVGTVLTVTMAMPAAAGTAIMSGKYGGDLPYASKLIALSTPLSMLTLPFMATLVNRLLQ